MAGQSYSNGMGSGSVILGQSHLYKLGQSNNMSQRHTYFGPVTPISGQVPGLGQGPQYWVRVPNIGSGPLILGQGPHIGSGPPNIGSGPPILGQGPQYWARTPNIRSRPPYWVRANDTESGMGPGPLILGHS